MATAGVSIFWGGSIDLFLKPPSRIPNRGGTVQKDAKPPDDSSAGETTDPDPVQKAASTVPGLQIVPGIVSNQAALQAEGADSAPVLPPPGSSADVYVQRVGHLIGKVLEGHARSLTEDLKTQKDKSHKLLERLREEKKERDKKMAAAHHGGLLKSVMGFIKKFSGRAGIGLSLGVAAVAASALTPATLAVLVVAAYMAAQQISGELGGPDLSLASNLQKVMASALQEAGMSRDQAMNTAGMVILAAAAAQPELVVIDARFAGIGVSSVAREAHASEQDAALIDACVTAVAALVGSAVMMRGLGGGAGAQQNLERLASRLMLLGQVGLGMTQATNGGAGVATGVLEMKQADAEELAALADAQVTLTNAETKFASFLQQNALKSLQGAAEKKDKFFQELADLVRTSLDGSEQVLKSMASRRA
jgi:hypothetical protein